MQIGLRTILAVATFFFLPFGFYEILIWWKRTPFRGGWRWRVANLLYVLALPLFPLRPVAPDWIAIIGANALVVAASVLCLEAAREFRGLRPPLLTSYVGGALTVAMLIYFDYFQNSVNARITAMSAFLGIVAGLCSATLLKQIPLRGRFGLIVAGSGFAISAAVHIARGIYFSFAPPLSDVLASTFSNTAFFIAAALSIVCSSVGWRVLKNHSLVVVLEDAQQTTARTFRELSAATRRASDMEKRAVAAEVAKGEFLETMNHEVRNPLGGVMAMMDLVLESDLTAEQQECLFIARSGVEGLLTLNDDLLDLYRIGDSGWKIESTAFDFKSVIEGVAGTYMPVAKAKGLDLVVEYSSRLPCRFIGDSRRIHQVMTNLVGQAVKLTSAGKIRIAAMCDGRDARHATMRIVVTGSALGAFPGSGESPIDLFQQDSGATPRAPRNIAIGLIIASRLIELMGGRVQMSKDGKAFAFVLTLQFEGGANSGRTV